MKSTLKTNGDETLEYFVTEDYDQFKFINENRRIKKGSVEALIASIRASNDLKTNPIIVTSDMFVVDGQTRLLAAKQLGVPIYYTIDDDYSPEKLIRFNNVSFKWGLEDYMQFYIKSNNENYIKFKEFKEDIGFPATICLDWFSDHPKKMSAAFKNGAFKFQISENILNAMLMTKKLIEYLKEINFKPVSLFHRHPFQRACKRFFGSGLVLEEQFFDRIRECPYKLHLDTTEGFIKQLVEIYNYGMKKSKISMISKDDKIEFITK